MPESAGLEIGVEELHVDELVSDIVVAVDDEAPMFVAGGGNPGAGLGENGTVMNVVDSMVVVTDTVEIATLLAVPMLEKSKL